MNFDWKMFFGTFFLIFLAELGDKTQLTALARSATGGRWVVFIAASLALVCSTLIAVLFGSLLKKYIPEFFIKLVAGALFLIFGVLTLFSAIKERNIVEPSSEEQAKTVFNLEINEGEPAGWVLKLAGYFEHKAARDYRDLAEKAEGELKELFLSLAEEEEAHLKRLQTGKPEGKPEMPNDSHERFKPLFHDVSDDIVTDYKNSGKAQNIGLQDDEKGLIAHAIEHEESTAEFYRELAKSVKIPAVKQNFALLARSENEHVKRLKGWLEKIGDTGDSGLT